MKFFAHRSICLAVTLAAANPAPAQTGIINPQAVVSAKTVYFDDKSGVDAVAKKACEELRKWARFQIVQDRQKADLIIVLSSDPQRGGNLVFSGQTGTIDSQGHVAEDPIPDYNKQAPVRYAFLTLMDVRTGDTLWSASQRWGGLLTGFDSVGEHLVQELEKQTRLAEQSFRLKVLKSVSPDYPQDVMQKQIEGTVVVRIVVGKSGTVTSAKAVSGRPELFRASEEAAKKYQFVPPENAPVTTELEMQYGLSPKPCPLGKTGRDGRVFYVEQLPMRSDHMGSLKIVSDLYTPLPPYPQESRAAGGEGDLKLFITVAPNGEVVGARVAESLDPWIDETALATIRAWKFKVSHGEQAAFPIELRYRLDCDLSTNR